MLELAIVLLAGVVGVIIGIVTLPPKDEFVIGDRLDKYTLSQLKYRDWTF